MATVSRNVAWLESTTALHACAASDAATGNIYAYVSSSATTPSAADLKAGTGAEASDSVAVSAAGRQFFAPMTVSAGTWYVHYIYNDGSSDSAIVTEGPFATTGPACVVTEKTTTTTARQYDIWMLEVFSASTWGVGRESMHRVTWTISGPDGWSWTETDRRTLSQTAGQQLDYRYKWVGRAISVPMTVAGTYTATATITDAEGNTSTSSEASITVAQAANVYTIGSGGDYATINAWATAKREEDDQEVQLIDATTYDVTANIVVAGAGVRFVNTSGGTATIRHNGGSLGLWVERQTLHGLNYRGAIGDGTEQPISFVNFESNLGYAVVGGQIENKILRFAEVTFSDDTWIAILGMDIPGDIIQRHTIGLVGGESSAVLTASGAFAASVNERPIRSTFAYQVYNDIYANQDISGDSGKSAIRMHKTARADITRGYLTSDIEFGNGPDGYAERVRIEAVESQFTEDGDDNVRFGVNINQGEDLGIAFVDTTVTAMVIVMTDTSLVSEAMAVNNVAAFSALHNTAYKGPGSTTQGLFKSADSRTLPTGFDNKLIGNIWAAADLSSTASATTQTWLNTEAITGYVFQDNIWPDITYSRNSTPYATISGASDTPAQYDAQTYTTNESHQVVTLDGASPSVSKAVTVAAGVHVDFDGNPAPLGLSGQAGATQDIAGLSPGTAPAGDTGAYAYAGSRFIYIVFDAGITYTEPGGFFVYPVTVSKPGGLTEAVNSLEVVSSNTLKIGFTGDTPAIGDSNWTVSISNGDGYITTTSNGAPIANQTDLAVAVTSQVFGRPRDRSRRR